MTGPYVVPDTINSNPLRGDFPQVAAQPPNLLGGRFMSDAPHIDGLIIPGIEQCAKDSANLLLVRSAAGDWVYSRTSAGAETYHVRLSLSQILRLGEVYQLGMFGSGQPTGNGPAKGVEISDFFAIMSIGVVDLTTATLRLGKTVYSNSSAAAGVVPTQTDLVAATNINKTAGTAGQYVYNDVAGPSPLVFHANDLGLIEIELTVVMANTGTVQIAALGAHVNFNYD